MENVNLCKCNNCDTILLDQNPQIDAERYEVNGNFSETFGTVEEMQYDDSGENGYWICPICETDEYLRDL